MTNRSTCTGKQITFIRALQNAVQNKSIGVISYTHSVPIQRVMALAMVTVHLTGAVIDSHVHVSPRTTFAPLHDDMLPSPDGNNDHLLREKHHVLVLISHAESVTGRGASTQHLMARYSGRSLIALIQNGTTEDVSIDVH